MTLPKKPELVTIEDYNIKYRDNVYATKNWGPNGTHSPLFITLGHHFWNMLVGHAESLPFIFDQKTGKETGFTVAGRQMIEDMLSDKDKNGAPNKTRRILVDVKHMSPVARKEYYQYIAELKNTTGLNVPVICSHASIGDAPSLDYFINEEKAEKGSKNYFNTSTLSLNDEDVKVIIDTDGIIGIVLHEGRIASKAAMKGKEYGVKGLRKAINKGQKKIERFQKELKTQITELRKQKLLEKIAEKMRQFDEYGNKMREAYTLMVLANIYRVVEVYANYKPAQKEKGWDHIGIGSDFDGMINKMDYLGTANEFPLLEELLIRYLTNPEPLTGFDASWTSDRLKELQFNQSPSTLAHKIMSQNSDDFLRKYFNESYLKFGENPVEKAGKDLIA